MYASIKIGSIVLSAAVLLSTGCASVKPTKSVATMKGKSAVAATSGTVTTAAKTVQSTVTSTTVAPLITYDESMSTTDPSEETYRTYSFTPAEENLKNEMVFIGDSICYGFSAYDIIPEKQVFAKGSVAARSIHDYDFEIPTGGSGDIIDAIAATTQTYLIFSMGMNDVNVVTEEQWTSDYQDLLEKAAQVRPDAKILVLSISPVRNTSDFCTNSKIDTYNNALKTMVESAGKDNWMFVDTSVELKNQYNELKFSYNGGDGIHFAVSAYTSVLWSVCHAIDGDLAELQG